MKNKIYIAGPITGDPEYSEKFSAAEAYLSWKGWRVLNPAILPADLDPADYMPICMAMLNQADAIVLLQGAQNSLGAQVEQYFAAYQKKTIYTSLEMVPVMKEE